MNHKVVLISTGGTIASRYDPAQGRVVASQSGDDLIAMLPGADAVAALEVDSYATIPSFDIPPSSRSAWGLMSTRPWRGPMSTESS